MTEFQVSHTTRWTVEGTSDSLPSLLSWTSEDPLAVRISFGDPVSGTVDWIFARELLGTVAEGLNSKAGEGDVTVSLQGDQVMLTLSVGWIRNLLTPLEEVKIFLQNTYMYAPLGAETVDMDATIGKLLDGGWASGV